MIPTQNYEVYVSFLFFVVAKIISVCAVYYRRNMKHPTLTSIPEKNEEEEEILTNKWVPKKKHEVLKAKYKCLKKLFQIYDANVLGMLPNQYQTNCESCIAEEEDRQYKKKKRVSKKADACAATSDISNLDLAECMSEKCVSVCVSTTSVRPTQQRSYSSTQLQNETHTKPSSPKFKYSQSQENLQSSERTFDCSRCFENLPQQIAQPMPYRMVNTRPKPTRFQVFMQRIFGLKPERPLRNFVLPNGHVYAASDNSGYDRRKRSGLRFRRLRRTNKIRSESALVDLKSPDILSYVQSVQKNCLMDTTPRQCPITGCRTMFYGIINYNDHLNLCHFTERKYICHYCHEGFEREYDKIVHENEHLGINKINSTITSNPSTSRHPKKVSDVQTDPEIDVPDEKLKKIVSFFDKIVESDLHLENLKKKETYTDSSSPTSYKSDSYCENSGDGSRRSERSESDRSEIVSYSTDKRTMSLVDFRGREKKYGFTVSEATSRLPYEAIKCHYCGETFAHRRQLSLHCDLEHHRLNTKCSKYHSCAGILNQPKDHRTQKCDLVSEDGKIQVESCCSSLDATETCTTLIPEKVSSRSLGKKSQDTIGDPSCVVYCTSLESVVAKKQSGVNESSSKKLKDGVSNYKWEPNRC